mmetsp:Transcript_11590/g.46841  ORF Transcript_11590/g.46841 Transcript_11590/m.46841 type:complete len:669 (-) Transcript_11590:12-2018(-)
MVYQYEQFLEPSAPVSPDALDDEGQWGQYEDARYSSELEITLKCQNMVNLDGRKLSSPMCVMYELNAERRWVETGRTEVVPMSLHPEFAKAFRVQFHFELHQPLLFRIYCVDDEVARLGTGKIALADLEEMGEAQTTVSAVISHPDQQVIVPIAFNGGSGGDLVVSAEEVVDCRYSMRMMFRAFGAVQGERSYLLVSRTDNLDGSERKTPVSKTAMVPASPVNNPSPIFPPIDVSLQRLCNGDLARPVLVELFTVRLGVGHVRLGGVKTTIPDLLESFHSEKRITIGHNKQIQLLYYQVDGRSFLDYIAGGCQISMQVAIDFTKSNKDMRNPLSLHYSTQVQPSAYENAIRQVGDILATFDRSGNHAVYGFGAQVKGAGGRLQPTSHCFHASMNPATPFVAGGVPGIVHCYKEVLPRIALSGPTYFRHIIKNAAEVARNTDQAQVQKYNILLLLTDGIIHDFQETIHEIVEASYLPLSIIIIGIGNADFTKMDQLCADEEPLVSSVTGKVMMQDIVKFVAFRDYDQRQPWKLTRDVLEEFPAQLLTHMKRYNVNPRVIQPPLPPALSMAANQPQVPPLPFVVNAQGVAQLPQWQPDSAAPVCNGCSSPFKLFFRRHHCRGCGQVFCDYCSQFRHRLKARTRDGQTRVEAQRFCSGCYSSILLNTTPVS